MTELTANPNLFKRGLKTHIDVLQIQKLLSDHMKSLPDLPSLRQDLELLNHLCSFLEELTHFSGLAAEKQAIIVDLYKSVYAPYTEAEVATLRRQIDYLHSIGRIKLRSGSKKYFILAARAIVKLVNFFVKNT